MGDSFGGTSSVTPVTLPTFGGVSEVTFDEPTAETFGGVSTVDLSTAAAWASPTRMTNVRVLLNGEDMTGLVGSVRITDAEDTPGLACEFELVDARNAALHAESFAIGGQDVEVWVTVRSRTGTDTRLEFVGVTEAPSNEEPYAPKATYRAIGVGSVWSETEVCTRIPAFSGLRRFNVLRDEAALRGLTLSTTIEGAQLTKPWEFIGTKYWEFLQRQAELEDVYWRPNVDGSLVGLTWAELKAQTPVATIRWSNSFTPRETPPQRPPTKLILAGTTMTDDVLDQTERVYQVSLETETFGRKSGTVSKATVKGGVTTQTVLETYETWPLAGVTAGADEYRLKRRETTDMTYPTVVLLNGETRYTPALSQRITEVEEYGAPQTYETDSPAYLWEDGTYRTQAEETFALRQRVTEDFTYRPDDGSETACQLETTTIKVEGYYAPLLPTVRHASDGTETALYRWGDGSYRGVETFVTTRETEETWQDSLGTEGPRRVVRRQSISAFLETAHERSYQWPGGASTTISPGETYKYAGVIMDVWTESHLSGSGERISSVADATTGENSYTPSMVGEKIPDIPRASALVPQYAADSFLVTWELTDHNYPTQEVRDLLEGAETAAEGVVAAKRRMSWGLATRWTVPLPMIPGLRRWDKLLLIDESRSTTAAGVEVYALGSTKDLDPTNGWLGSDVIVGRPQEIV